MIWEAIFHAGQPSFRLSHLQKPVRLTPLNLPYPDHTPVIFSNAPEQKDHWAEAEDEFRKDSVGLALASGPRLKHSAYDVCS